MDIQTDRHSHQHSNGKPNTSVVSEHHGNQQSEAHSKRHSVHSVVLGGFILAFFVDAAPRITRIATSSPIATHGNVARINSLASFIVIKPVTSFPFFQQKTQRTPILWVALRLSVWRLARFNYSAASFKNFLSDWMLWVTNFPSRNNAYVVTGAGTF